MEFFAHCFLLTLIDMAAENQTTIYFCFHSLTIAGYFESHPLRHLKALKTLRFQGFFVFRPVLAPRGHASALQTEIFSFLFARNTL